MRISTDFASLEFFYSLACFTFILSGVFCAVVRWCHMCHPFDEQGDFFYPARRQMTFFYAALVLQFPYVLCPSDADAWFYVRSFGILFYPVCFAMAFHRYFQMGKMRRNLSSVLYFFLPFLLLGTLSLMVLFCKNEFLVANKLVWECIMGGLSILFSFRLVQENRWLVRMVDDYHTQNYSNDSDFPFVFASKVIYLPMTFLLVMWVVFLADSRTLKAVIDLLVTVWNVMFLCKILHPNKIIHTEEDKECMAIMEKENLQRVLQESASLEEMTPIPDESRIGVADNVMQDAFEEEKANLRLQMEQENWESVKKEVLIIVSRRYLEPSLKRVEVIRDVSMMNHTLAGTFITQVGFYKLVNAFRVRHYEKLMESSAGTYGQEAAAELCGFKNRWALTNARKRLGDFDYSLIEDYI